MWRCWVLEDGDRIVGHVWVGLVEKIPNPVGEAEHHAYLSNLYVREDDRGGAGAQLVAAALAWCRTQRVDYVILWPSERSRSLYERYGFGPDDGILALKVSR